MDGRKKKFILELQKKPRLRRESELYVIDGPKMAGELPAELAEEIYVTKDFLSSERAEAAAGLLRNRPYVLVQESEMKQISDTVTPQGILVVARMCKKRTVRDIAGGKVSEAVPLLLILETVQDPGNLGTIMRSAEAAGVSGIIMNRDCADIYSPKVVRSTMGAIFRVPFAVVDDLETAVSDLRTGHYTDGQGMNVYAAHLEGSVDYAEADFRAAFAVMIGNESNGLSEELTGLASKCIRIPMAGQAESLNAAVAASVICFEAARQRRNCNK